MVKLILGLAADISAGKDTAARYLAEKYGFEKHTISDILRGEARAKKIKPTRENLTKLAQVLRKKEGKHALVKRLIKKFKKEKIVIAGIREPEEVYCLREQFPGKVKLLRLTADAKVRFERIKSRRRTGDPKTLKEFLNQEQKEWKEFNLKKLFKMVDYMIKNNGTIEEMYKKIDSVVKKTAKSI